MPGASSGDEPLAFNQEIATVCQRAAWVATSESLATCEDQFSNFLNLCGDKISDAWENVEQIEPMKKTIAENQ